MKTLRLYLEKAWLLCNIPGDNYHCCDKNPKEKVQAMASALCLFFISGIFFLIFYTNFRKGTDDFYGLVLAAYFFVFTAFWGLFFLLEYVYRHGQKKHKLFTTMSIIVLYYLICVVGLLISLPIIITISVASKVIAYRAKTRQNFEEVIRMLFYDFILVALVVAIEKKFSFLVRVTELIGYRICLNSFAVHLFLLMGVIVLTVRVYNYFRLEWHYFKRKRDIQIEVERMKEENKVRRRYASKRMKELAYEYMYKRKTLFKMQLFALIAFFFYVTLCNYPSVAENRGDIVNVITCYTLIILYLDKRKEYANIV